jgi:DNA transposition AAA+ family ATPase
MADQERIIFGQAVSAIYNSDNSANRARAEQWLEEWQRQESAWEAAEKILSDEQSSGDERFMAAQTLRTKVLHTFE